ncbi:sensor histidine kinase [Streptomyces sp. ISL-98]|uniref:sensor histidine kinase n=1 Tax=Streptomyces sp. ISL-98 TaxID=2819192 RepID=UPI0020353218|nr:sensor histidine kinase [Streptomyces sp. ISL-98]
MALPQRTVTFAVGAGVALVTVVGTLVRDRDAYESPGRLLLGWALIAVGCSALVWRRRWPVPVAVVTLLCCAAYFPVSTVDLPVLLLAYAYALYTVAAQGHLASAITLAVVTMLSTVYVEQVVTSGERHVDDAAIFLMAGWFVGVIAIGQAHRTHQAYLREVEQRVRAAEREKDVRARQSATEERLRIARELHDVLGHNISLINVQAGAALHRHSKRPRGPEELVPALEAIRDSSKDALRELRATLGVLRQVDGEDGAPVTPTAGIERLDELTARARAAGLDIRTTVEGAAQELPPQVSLAAYRIVQESLTNVARHAQARTAVVTVRCDGDNVVVRIEDDGRGSAPGAEGSGINGMAERARALGGELTAVDTGSGFRVEARIPVGGGA